MALTCGFFNSVDGDRKYDATQFASLFDGVITDGVVAAVGDFFATTPGGGMTVDVGTGRAWFNRTWTYSDAKIPLTLDASDLLYDRIDAIVLEIDTSIAVRDNSIKVIKGTPAQEPQKPSLTNAGDIHQYALAYVRVKASSIEIGAGDITINVGQADCPFVTSIIETPELEVLFAQWDAQFTEWFENVQSQLEGDVATNLQRQIDLKADKVDIGDFESSAKKIGLQGDLSVGASLNVLSEIGNLNLWRKTTTTSEKIPGSYTTKRIYLSSSDQYSLVFLGDGSASKASVTYSSSITISDDGIPILNNPVTMEYRSDDKYVQNFKGKYLKISARSDYKSDQIAPNTVYFIPSNATIGHHTNNYGWITCNNISKVVGSPAIPAGIDIKYLVSIDENAYQTGDNSTPAGYKLGSIVNRDIIIAGFGSFNNDESYRYGDVPIVNDDGTLDPDKLPNSISLNPSDSGANQANLNLRGKYIARISKNTNAAFPVNQVVFIPSDAVFTYKNAETGDFGLHLNKYQTVTGYPAIPANTVVNYLGSFGERVKAKTISYLGTAVYGKDHPNKIEVDGRILAVFMLYSETTSDGRISSLWPGNQNYKNLAMLENALTTEYKPNSGLSANTYNGDYYGKKSESGNTFYWYYTDSSSGQFNSSGVKYHALVIYE